MALNCTSGIRNEILRRSPQMAPNGVNPPTEDTTMSTASEHTVPPGPTPGAIWGSRGSQVQILSAEIS